MDFLLSPLLLKNIIAFSGWLYPIDACGNNALFGRGEFGAPTRSEKGA
jgi:hypothetical protein